MLNYFAKSLNFYIILYNDGNVNHFEKLPPVFIRNSFWLLIIIFTGIHVCRKTKCRIVQGIPVCELLHYKIYLNNVLNFENFHTNGCINYKCILLIILILDS